MRFEREQQSASSSAENRENRENLRPHRRIDVFFSFPREDDVNVSAKKTALEDAPEDSGIARHQFFCSGLVVQKIALCPE